jgi:RNA polymerase sigma-70 factor, ECF subfamily
MDSLSEIVHLAQTGDPDAITRLVRLYQQPALRVAQNILGSSQEGEDVLQEAWILIIQNLNTLRDPEKFNFWLYQIVKNLALRYRQNRNRGLADVSLLEEFIHASSASEPGESLEQWLPIAINALSDKDYLVISLH